MSARLAFILPLNPSAAVRPPKGDDWLHEPIWDGFRFQIIKDSAGVGFYSRYGADYTERLPRMREAFGKLPTQSAILDGELVLIEPGGAAHFYKLMAEMRTRWPDESQLMFLVFDLLHQDGVDLRGLPLFERKRDCTGFASNPGCPSCARCKPSPMGRCYSSIAASSVSRVSLASATRRALDRTKPQLGQDEVPGLDARQRRAA